MTDDVVTRVEMKLVVNWSIPGGWHVCPEPWERPARITEPKLESFVDYTKRYTMLARQTFKVPAESALILSEVGWCDV